MKRGLEVFTAAVLAALLLASCSRTPPDGTDKEPEEKTPAVIQPYGEGEAMERRWLPQQEPQAPPQPLENGHRALSVNEYYGRSLLEGDELELYERLVEAVDECRNFVEAEDLSIDREQFAKVFQYMVLDYPQFFYLSKSYQFRYYESAPQRPIVIILNYFDGRVTDQVAGDYSLTAEADRSLIGEQRARLERVVQSALRDISPSLEEGEKERLAHDWVTAAADYDNAAAATLDVQGVDSHSFSSYGALVGGLAVCEGYSEAFQYLLYRMGIQSLLVIGESEGQPHQWNLVRVDGEYYHVDPTWDDTDIFAELGLACYYYLNMSDEMILRDHTIGRWAGQEGGYGYPVPAAPSDDGYYYAERALSIGPDGALPPDLGERVDALSELGSPYLLLLFEPDWGAGEVKSWINATLWESGGALPQALDEAGLELDTAYYSVSRWSLALVPIL